MNKREPANGIVDFLSEEQHRIQDENLLQDVGFRASFVHVNDNNSIRALQALCYIVRSVAMDANDDGRQYMKTRKGDIAALVEENPEIQATIRQAVQAKNFRAIRMIPQFRTETIYKKPKFEGSFLKNTAADNNVPALDLDIEDRAIALSWKEEYIGTAWKILENKMHYIREENKKGPFNRRYARFFALVQSSGTGKSRLIDEYSKHHVVIPLCLREDGGTGFPPPDREARNFLCRAEYYDDSLRDAHAFHFALFEVAAEYFNNIDTLMPLSSAPMSTLAEKFHGLMSSPSHRQAFYSKVTSRALEIQADVIITGNGNLPRTPIKKGKSVIKSVIDVAKTLVETLHRLVPKSGEDKFEAPILLSFDEAHTLNEPLKDAPTWSSQFSIRYVLRNLRQHPIFMLFVSTARRFSKFVPATKDDPTSRVQTVQLHIPDPICGIGYDLMAEDFVTEGKHPLSYYASDESMSRFGRPLFYTRWKHGDPDVRNRLVEFAGEKILGGSVSTKEKLRTSQILALLSIRIPLEFNATTPDGQREAFTQVLKHMRISIAVDDDNEICETVQPAEPLLAEAAFSIIKAKRINQAEELLEVLGGSTISEGDRRALVCVLLWLLARDKRVQKQEDGQNDKATSRVVKVLDLMDDLLNSKWFEPVKEARPTFLKDGGDNVRFCEAFEDSVTYFTQFIKVHDHKVINRSFLWMVLARGAAILRANNQGGFDIIIPFLIRNMPLERKNVSAIIIKVTNDVSYGADPDDLLFDLMDPYHIGLFNSKEESTHPVIRMVFALGASQSNVEVMQPSLEEEEALQPPSFTSYDIWCAMASEETFSVIQSDKTFTELLEVQRIFPKLYESDVAGEEDAKRWMHTMAFSDPTHWRFGATADAKDDSNLDEEV